MDVGERSARGQLHAPDRSRRSRSLNLGDDGARLRLARPRRLSQDTQRQRFGVGGLPSRRRHSGYRGRGVALAARQAGAGAMLVARCLSTGRSIRASGGLCRGQRAPATSPCGKGGAVRRTFSNPGRLASLRRCRRSRQARSARHRPLGRAERRSTGQTRSGACAGDRSGDCCRAKAVRCAGPMGTNSRYFGRRGERLRSIH